jgi:hypothetical protein
LVEHQDPTAGTPLPGKPLFATLLLGNSLSSVDQATLVILAHYPGEEE